MTAHFKLSIEKKQKAYLKKLFAVLNFLKNEEIKFFIFVAKPDISHLVNQKYFDIVPSILYLYY